MINLNYAPLFRLQEADLRLRELEARLVLIPAELDKILARRDELKNFERLAGEAVKKLELAIKNGESSIEQLKAESLKLQQQSALVKKNTEYQALLAAIAANKEKIGAIEEKVLMQFDELEAARKQQAQTAANIAEDLAEAKEEFTQLRAFGIDLKAEIDKMRAARPQLRAKVTVPELARYEELLQDRDKTIPIVKVENEACGNCGIAITAQTINNLIRGKLEVCSNCQHFLWMPDGE